jgi:iron complex transport system permease protein
LSTNKKLWLLAGTVLLALAVTPFLGIVAIDPLAVLQQNPGSFIFWQLRLPRALLGFAAGGILALSGLVCQNLFKNNLATPDLLGISSGAAAGAVVALQFKVGLTFLGAGGMVLFSFLGALAAILAIFAIARMIRSSSLYTFLMSGIAINYFFSSVIVICQYVFDFADTFSLLRWLTGPSWSPATGRSFFCWRCWPSSWSAFCCCVMNFCWSRPGTILP